MAIPQWIKKTAEEADKHDSINFADGTYNKLIDMYKSGALDEWASQIVEEVECLRSVMNNAVSEVSRKLGLVKTAAPAAPAAPKEGPLDFGDERLKEVPAPGATSPNRKMSPKMKEPETTKWKEIRFNKRTGTWQTVVTIRHVRNFMTEDEAVDFTKKAGLDKNTLEIVETSDQK